MPRFELLNDKDLPALADAALDVLELVDADGTPLYEHAGRLI